MKKKNLITMLLMIGMISGIVPVLADFPPPPPAPTTYLIRSMNHVDSHWTSIFGSLSDVVSVNNDYAWMYCEYDDYFDWDDPITDRFQLIDEVRLSIKVICSDPGSYCWSVKFDGWTYGSYLDGNYMGTGNEFVISDLDNLNFNQVEILIDVPSGETVELRVDCIRVIDTDE